MVVVTLQRNKCIGCNYCVELAPNQFQMSKKDGKSVLLHAIDKKGFCTLKSIENDILEACEKERLDTKEQLKKAGYSIQDTAEQVDKIIQTSLEKSVQWERVN